MREEKPKENTPPSMTDIQKKRLAAEMEAGRQAVARHQAEIDRVKELKARLDAQERAKQAQMAPVVHPNPTMNEVFPVSKATFK